MTVHDNLKSYDNAVKNEGHSPFDFATSGHMAQTEIGITYRIVEITFHNNWRTCIECHSEQEEKRSGYVGWKVVSTTIIPPAGKNQSAITDRCYTIYGYVCDCPDQKRTDATTEYLNGVKE
jgi:hypothetical protein